MPKPKTPKPDIGRRIDALMKASPDLGSQKGLEQKSGVPQATIGRIIRGEVNPSIDNVERIADAYGVSIDFLVKGRSLNAADRRHDLNDTPSHGASQPGRPDPVILSRAMRLLSFVSQILGSPGAFSEDGAALAAAYDLVSLRPSDFDLEDASKRMSEWLRAREQHGRVDRRDAVGARGKVGRED